MSVYLYVNTKLYRCKILNMNIYNYFLNLTQFIDVKYRMKKKHKNKNIYIQRAHYSIKLLRSGQLPTSSVMGKIEGSWDFLGMVTAGES